MSRLDFQPDISKYEPVAETSRSMAPSPEATPEITGYNPSLVCPIPLFSSNPDGLRQFYRRGIPQSRLFSPGSLSSPLTK